MEKRMGVWIDRREATLVTLLPGGEKIERIESGVFGTMEAHRGVPGDGARERSLDHQLLAFYDRVIEAVKRADRLVVLGPGAARHHFIARLVHRHPRMAAPLVGAAPRLTESQLVLRVRERFRDASPPEEGAVPAVAAGPAGG
ncbi:MAG: hypothetical protein ACKO5K_09600 [Armatimonadota bacterium]